MCFLTLHVHKQSIVSQSKKTIVHLFKCSYHNFSVLSYISFPICIHTSSCVKPRLIHHVEVNLSWSIQVSTKFLFIFVCVFIFSTFFSVFSFSFFHIAFPLCSQDNIIQPSSIIFMNSIFLSMPYCFSTMWSRQKIHLKKLFLFFYTNSC